MGGRGGLEEGEKRNGQMIEMMVMIKEGMSTGLGKRGLGDAWDLISNLPALFSPAADSLVCG
jgi:hypothetical protein